MIVDMTYMGVKDSIVECLEEDKRIIKKIQEYFPSFRLTYLNLKYNMHAVIN